MDCLNKSFATTERKQLEAPVQMNFATLAFTKEAWKFIALNLVFTLMLERSFRIKRLDKIVQ